MMPSRDCVKASPRAWCCRAWSCRGYCPNYRRISGCRRPKTEFWQPVVKFPASFSATDRARLTRAYRRKIESVIEPAYRRLYGYLKVEYLPHARDSVGLGQIPGGAALYNLRRALSHHHSTHGGGDQQAWGGRSVENRSGTCQGSGAAAHRRRLAAALRAGARRHGSKIQFP
jgi:hypothetical protein